MKHFLLFRWLWSLTLHILLGSSARKSQTPLQINKWSACRKLQRGIVCFKGPYWCSPDPIVKEGSFYAHMYTPFESHTFCFGIQSCLRFKCLHLHWWTPAELDRLLETRSARKYPECFDIMQLLTECQLLIFVENLLV